jgi:hypothetical protein
MRETRSIVSTELTPILNPNDDLKAAVNAYFLAHRFRIAADQLP